MNIRSFLLSVSLVLALLAPFTAVGITLKETLNNPTPQPQTRFGASIAGLGDINGDFVGDRGGGRPRTGGQR